MIKNILKTAVIFLIVFFYSCKQDNSKNKHIKITQDTETVEKVPIIDPKTPVDDYAKQSVDDALAEKLKIYISTQFLNKEDLNIISDNQRKFQLYKIDLNNDGENEVFINFLTSYFCGTGGCTLLLLNNNLELITKFTTTRTLFVEQTFQNDWRVIMTESQGSWRKLIFDSGSYPSNPSMEDITNEFPSGHAEVLFDEIYSKAKTYLF
ncbi:hypothetical protein [Algibacter mikhailovii]|uniref:Uncharacterized protein n=1 Tax=Algibacter mikhailovii TaxID=425498 RepID=A0A918V820_9FLAO|nr:hypothetical protein [Algibacter mikhailovii]GGZ77310.1 hypothetical protein GCM10007028_13210 [Algibacter mikhailovii]